MVITSTQNPIVKSFAALHDVKGRRESKAYLIEGLRFVEEAVEAQVPISDVLYTEELTRGERGSRLLTLLERAGAKLVPVSDHVLRAAAQTKTPQGIVARVRQVAVTAQDLPKGARIVVVDRVQDPGNLGTIIRTAAANDMDGVFLLQGTVELYNDKVLRSTMGALFNVPIYTDVSPDEIRSICSKCGLSLVVAMMAGECLPHEADLRVSVALVVGNEGAGVCQSLIQCADRTIRIPMPGKAESLNVAVAAGILMYESTRQRLVGR